MFYRALVKPLLFLLPAESAHRLVIWLLAQLARSSWACALVARLCAPRDPALRVRAFGRELCSPVGLAAGLDKDAEAFDAFAALGFGFVEVGTLTAQAQPGNPQPRLFRLPEDRALINRMGFNNRGAAAAARALLAHGPRRGVLGINIGKTKSVAHADAVADYVASARLLAAHADYLVVNVSSPNTPGLRDLQAIEALRPLLAGVRAALEAAVRDRRVPLLVKIAPDLADADVDAVADLALELGLDGIIAVNTTIARSGLQSSAGELALAGEGGLSGAPLGGRALEVLRRLRARAGERMLLISVGGVQSADDALERFAAGATLVQIYTALIYEGPALVRRINRALAARLRASS